MFLREFFGRAARIQDQRIGLACVRQGFSLIELLVVTAIISLLVSIIIPSLSQARRLAEKVVCLGNLHNIGIAAMNYTTNYSGYIPRGNDLIWFNAFLPYVGGNKQVADYRYVKIYRCPSFPIEEQTVCYVDSSWSFDGRSDPVGFEVNEPTSVSTFDYPDQTIYISENDDGWWRQIITGPNDPNIDRQDVWNPGHLPDSSSTDITYGRRVSPNRHLAGCNCAFLDGHATWVAADDMTVDMWRDKWD